MAAQAPLDVILKAMGIEDGLGALAKVNVRQLSGETKVEHDFQLPRYDIGCTGAAVNIGNLHGSWGKVTIAFVPNFMGQCGQRWRRPMDWVVSQVRVGDVSLHAFNDKSGVQRTTPAVFDDVAQCAGAGGFAYQAPVNFLSLLLQPRPITRTVPSLAGPSSSEVIRNPMRPVWSGLLAKNSSQATTMAARLPFMSAAPLP